MSSSSYIIIMTNIIAIITTIKNIVIITMTNNGSVGQCQLYWHHHQAWQLTLPSCALALSYTDGNFHHCPQMETFFALSPTDGNFHYISIHRWKLFSLHYQTIITASSSTDGNYRHYNLECLQHHAQILSHFMLVCITVHNSTQPKSLFIIISI